MDRHGIAIPDNAGAAVSAIRLLQSSGGLPEDLSTPKLIRVLNRALLRVKGSDVEITLPFTIGGWTFGSDLTLSGTGGVAFPIRTVTTDVTAQASDHTILVNATSANRTVTLPAAASNAKRLYKVKKIDASGNTVTIDGNASETIDGATTKVLSTQYQSIEIHCDGTSWWIVG